MFFDDFDLLSNQFEFPSLRSSLNRPRLSYYPISRLSDSYRRPIYDSFWNYFDAPRHPLGGQARDWRRQDYNQSLDSQQEELENTREHDYYDEEYRQRLTEIDSQYKKALEEVKKRFEEEMRKAIQEQKENRSARLSARKAPYKILEESEEFYRNENGRRVRVKKITDTYSDKEQKVRESVYETEADQRMLEEKDYWLDAQGKRIDDRQE